MTSCHMSLTVCIILHSKPNVDIAFPHLRTIVHDKFIFFCTLDRQKAYEKRTKNTIIKKHTHKKDTIANISRMLLFFLFLSSEISTKSYAVRKCWFICVAFNFVFFSVDKVVTSVSKGNPSASICRAIWEKIIIIEEIYTIIFFCKPKLQLQLIKFKIGLYMSYVLIWNDLEQYSGKARSCKKILHLHFYSK